MALSLMLWGNVTEAKSNEVTPQDNNIEENLSRVYQAQSVITYYEVSKGDNLKKIAQKNEVSAEEIRIWNNLESDNIHAGSKLKIQKIEYILVEKPLLKEPELLTLHLDEEVASGIMASYVSKQGGNAVISDRSDIEDISQQVALYAASNMKDYQGVITTKKNSFWNKLSDATNTAFSSVKDFSGTLVNKLKPRKAAEVLLAENSTVETEESSVEEIMEDIAELQDNIHLDSAGSESSYLTEGLTKVYHKVKIGETITQIATRYNVSKDDIITWNNLSSGMAKVRQRLLIYVPKNYTYISNHNRAGYY